MMSPQIGIIQGFNMTKIVSWIVHFILKYDKNTYIQVFEF